MAIGQELLNVPMGEMIYSMASAIARSQLELDHASIETAEMMGGLKTVTNDQGAVTFTDSRVFFGHEYMTIAEAMVTQTGNAAVDRLVSSETLAAYRRYTGQVTADPTTENSAPTQNVVAAPLTAPNLKLYQDNAQAIRNRLLYLEGQLANPPSSATPATITALRALITDYKSVQQSNAAAVEATLQRQVQVPTRVSLLELGFAPVFYVFVDTIIEVKISISITQESSSTTTTETTGRSVQGNIAFRGIPFLRGRMNRTREVSTSQVNGTYSTKYSHTAEGSSLLRTKLSPVPTPAVLEERIRGIMAAEQARKAAMLALLTTAAGTA